MNARRWSKPVSILLICFLCSFVGGCTAKLAYEFYNGPVWLNSVIVALFVGLGACFGSLMVITSSMERWKSNSNDDRPIAVLGFILWTPMFLLGLLALWKALQNFFSLFIVK